MIEEKEKEEKESPKKPGTRRKRTAQGKKEADRREVDQKEAEKGKKEEERPLGKKEADQREAEKGKKEEEGPELSEIFSELDSLLERLEGEESLEKSFSLYERGVRLIREAAGSIDRIEKEVKVLDEDGILP